MNVPERPEDWRTPAEIAGYRTTPDYAGTVAYIERLALAHPGQIRIENFGETGQGRELKIVIASKDGVFEPEAIHASGRVVLLVQNSIHAGEMDGKDACLALLRDIVRNPEHARLLDRVVFVFIPVYNLDGHERRSPFHRINQNGPEVAGWRANATHLNLNRDYLKADAPETRALLRLLRRWRPDFFVDDHVTDGADFQYDVTFVLDASPNVFPPTAAWIRDEVTPGLVRAVDASGHLAFPGPVFLKDDADPAQGLIVPENPPRFSTGYMILENRPALLVELHMLKDYRTRVTANYELLRAVLERLNQDAPRLLGLNRDADRAASALGSDSGRRMDYPLRLEPTRETTKVPFRGYAFVREPSEVSGVTAIRYTHETWNVELPMPTGVRVSASIRPPAGYIVPREWTHVIDVLDAHGLEIRRTTAPWTGRVERYRLSGMRWNGPPYEGRHPIVQGSPVDANAGHFGTCTRTIEELTFGAASAVVALDQPLSQVAIHWLEPEAPDSAVRWGFFDAIFEEKEHGESYVVERLAREELARDPALRREFEERLASDARFAASASERRQFFFERSPWGRANRVGEYPVGRLRALDGVPIAPRAVRRPQG